MDVARRNDNTILQNLTDIGLSCTHVILLLLDSWRNYFAQDLT